MATRSKSKDRNTGQQKKQAEWHRISFFGRLVEIVAQYFKNGSSVYVEGRLQTRKYTDNDGIEKYATDIIAQEMQMLGSRQAGDDDMSDDGTAAPRPALAPPAPPSRNVPTKQPVRTFPASLMKMSESHFRWFRDAGM